MVSILIPVFNRAQFIGPAIESALDQTHRDIEVVVVDNHSSDDTWSIIQKYSARDSRIKAFRNETNIGPVRNWKRCVEEASATYAKILWSDDLIAPDFIEKTLPFLADDDVGFVFTGANLFSEKGMGRPLHFIAETGVYPTEKYIRGILVGRDFPVSPGCALFRLADLRRNLLVHVPNNIGSDFSQHAIGNDVLIFLMTAAKYPRFAFVAESLSFFRWHDGSITVSTGWLRLHGLYYVAKEYFVSKHLRDEDIRREFAATRAGPRKWVKRILILSYVFVRKIRYRLGWSRPQ